MKILLVEPNEFFASDLALALSEQHHVVEVTNDGYRGFELAEYFNYDLLLFASDIPSINGIQLCFKLRSCGKTMPILLMNDADSINSRIIGLDAGADDCLAKPFAVEELAARIRALLRRGSSIPPPVLQWADLSLNPATCEVTYSGQPLRPTPKEYCLLELFLRHSRRIFNRSAIIEHLWDFESPPEEDTVNKRQRGRGAEELQEQGSRGAGEQRRERMDKSVLLWDHIAECYFLLSPLPLCSPAPLPLRSKLISKGYAKN